MKKKWIAECIDNTDPDNEGKITIYIEPLHHDLQPSQYQVAMQDREWTSNIPEIGDFIWVWFEDEEFYRKPFYGNKINLKNYNSHNQTIGSCEGSYPDIKYIQLKNGVSIALNSNETEMSIIAGNSEIYIDPSGNINLNGAEINLMGSSNINIEGSEINLNGSNKQFITWTEFNTVIQIFVTALNALFATKLNGSGSPGTLTLDLSPAKTTTVLTGG